MPKPGCITPSRFKDVMTSGRSKTELFGKTAHTYAMELAMNRVCNVFVPDKENLWAIEHGLAYEPYAIEAYEAHVIDTTEKPDEPITHPLIDYVAGTPDLLVGTDGLAEIKCPANPLNHVANLVSAEQYDQYKWQVQGYLWITGRQWVDFVSYGADFPEAYQLAVWRFERDDTAIAELSDRVAQFEQIVLEYCDMIREKGAQGNA